MASKKKKIKVVQLKPGDFFTDDTGDLYMIVGVGYPYSLPVGVALVVNMKAPRYYVTHYNSDTLVTKEAVEIKRLINDHGVEHIDTI